MHNKEAINIGRVAVCNRAHTASHISGIIGPMIDGKRRIIWPKRGATNNAAPSSHCGCNEVAHASKYARDTAEGSDPPHDKIASPFAALRKAFIASKAFWTTPTSSEVFANVETFSNVAANADLATFSSTQAFNKHAKMSNDASTNISGCSSGV